MFKSLLAVALMTAALITIPLFANADGEAQKARFKPWLSLIDQSLKSSDKADNVAEDLLKGDNRIAAFNLQELGKLYTVQDSDFTSEIRSAFRDLENGIGEYDKWKKIADKTGKQKDQERAEKAKQEFAKVLTDKKWIGGGSKDRMKRIQSFLKKQDWLSYEDDKQQMLGQLIEQIDSVAANSYDLGRLEKRDGDGRGLHELRREIRWFTIESRVLNGLLQFRENPEVCSVEIYKDLYKTPLATSKYSTLPGSELETDPCRIEHCLFLGLSRAVNILGEIKDFAEQDEESRETDTVPASKRAEAEGLYKELKDNQVFEKISQNLRQCQ